MARAFPARRAVWLIIGLATILTVVTTAAVGLATPTDEITLVVTSNDGEFQYAGLTPQALLADKSSCKLNEASTNGPIVELSATTFARNGNPVDPAPIGLVGGRLGVNKNGNGNDSSCGRVDWLGEGQSEALTMRLGSAMSGKAMTSVSLDLDAKSGDTVEIEFLLGTASVGATGPVAAESAITVAPASGNAFDAIRITAGTESNVGIVGGTFRLRDLVIAAPTITVAPRDAVTPIGSDVYLDFTIDNSTSEVPADVRITESGATSPDCDLTVAGGATAYCSATRTVDDVENSISFNGEADVPTLGTVPIAITPTPVLYYGGIGCGASTFAGGDGATDTPYLYFWNGPENTNSDAEGPACAVPVLVTTGTSGDGTYDFANALPPTGVSFGPATGIITIEWDAEDPENDGTIETLEVLAASNEPIDWCSGDTKVEIAPVTLASGQVVYELADDSALYPEATGDRNVCRVKRITDTVVVAGETLIQVSEVFYFDNDPGFIRPK